MKYIVSVVIFLSLFVSAQAQNSFLIQGQVLNDTIERASLNVVNISMRKGAITNTKGQFRIVARLNDTIHISAVQYESKQFMVTNKMMFERYVAFYLVPKITELDEVIVSNIDLTGDLREDIANLTLHKVYTPQVFGLPMNTAKERTTEERRFYTSGSGINTEGVQFGFGLVVPLPLLLTSISGKRKRLEKHVEVSNFQRKVDAYRVAFPDSFYMDRLDITIDQIEDFVFYVLDTTTEIHSLHAKDRLALHLLFTSKAALFLKLKKEENETKIQKTK